MKEYKTKVTGKAFALYGYTIEEYTRWCMKHEIAPYKTESKRIFFKYINDYKIVKVNGKMLEDGKEI